MEDKVERNTQAEQLYEKRIKIYEDSLREMQDMECSNIWIIGTPEGEEKEHGIENLFEKTMTENFLNLERRKATLSSGSTKGPKQEEPKEAHCKTHQN